MGYLVENAMKKTNDEALKIIVDLGYVKDAEEKFNALREYGIGKKNFSVECFSRLVMRCPKSKLKGIMEKFPIVEGGHYWQTTHSWADFDVKRNRNEGLYE